MVLRSYHARQLAYVCVVIVVLYAIIHYLDWKAEEVAEREASVVELSQEGCKHPLLDINSPEIMKFVKDEGPIVCSKEEDWVEVDGSNAFITNETKNKYGDIKCSFTDILRMNDFANELGFTAATHSEYRLNRSDFVRVKCDSESGTRWSSVLAGVRHDQEVLDRSGWHLLPPTALGLNVLMFGFDSLSKNTFIRKLPNSYNYLKETLKAVVLEGYNIVGDGTPQALIPILTGRTELELPDTRKRMGSKAVHVNVYPFVWNTFKEYGYVTGYLEDTPWMGIFSYRLKGFDEVPTDHYMRTFYSSVKPEHEKYKKFCVGSIPRHKIMLNYAKHMYRVYKDRPKFIFGFHGELSHDSYNLIGAADNDLKWWLESLKCEGYLNNTLLILMSDHGHRFAEVRNTQQGKLEERLPWFSFVLPPWFETVYPTAMANLRSNIHRLTSPFDIYPTLTSVLHPPPFIKGNVSHRSISLFQEVPKERTCSDAFIEPHWCACLDWEPVGCNDPLVLGAARHLINGINKYNSALSDKCQVLEMKEVQRAARLLPSSALRRFRSSRDRDGLVPDLSADTPITVVMYQVKVLASPGGAIFEASVSYDFSREEYFFKIDDVSRINQYGPQASCIEHSQEQLRKFCLCKN